MTSTYTVSDLQLAQAKLLGIRDPKRNCEGAWADRLRWRLVACSARIAMRFGWRWTTPTLARFGARRAAKAPVANQVTLTPALCGGQD